MRGAKCPKNASNYLSVNMTLYPRILESSSTAVIISTWTLEAAHQKYLESFEMWCWRRMEKNSWTDHVRNEEVLLTVNKQRNILHEIRKWKANWIGHILRRNCLLKQVIEGKIKGEMEVARRRGRRCKKLLDDLKDRRGYFHLKEEALDRIMWRNRFGRGVGPVVRQSTEWMNEKRIRHTPSAVCLDLPYISTLSHKRPHFRQKSFWT